MSGVDHVGVLVPVRDEEQLLPGCLDALMAAVAHLAGSHPAVQVRVVVVLDGCTDGSRAVVAAARRLAVVAVETPALGVGAARAAGARLLLGRACDDGHDPARTWLASTDADSTVPTAWLSAQVDAATGGADAWVGTVELASDHPAGSLRARTAARWSSHQRHHEGHDHVHGANLGVRGSVYLEAGGFPAVVTGEDVLLVDRLRLAGAVLVRTARHPVTTSDRPDGRAPDGVSDDLVELAGLEAALGALPAVPQPVPGLSPGPAHAPSRTA